LTFASSVLVIRPQRNGVFPEMHETIFSQLEASVKSSLKQNWRKQTAGWMGGFPLDLAHTK
jgi:hypothetical protein